MKWDQPPLPGGGEPENPVPTLALAAGPPASHDHQPSSAPAGDRAATTPRPASSDNTARLLGGAALVLGALAVAVALIRRRA